MQKLNPGAARLSLALLASLLHAPQALAQDATAQAAPVDVIPVAAESASPLPEAAAPRRGLGVEEVIVTAQKREESINDVPIAISAFSGEDLEALGVTDTRDLNNLVPGFSYGESGYNTPVYSLRGVGFNEASQTASATVGVYIDEINLPFAIMSKGANLDIERVEVLKGPQGTLYGRNTTGGAINYIAKKPTDAFDSGIKGSVGRFQATDIEGYVSGPLTETIKARLALRDIRSQQGWQVSNTRPDDRLGKQDKQAGRLIVDWQALEHLKFAFTLDGWNDSSEPQAPQAIGVRIQNAILGDVFGLTTGDRNNGLAPSVRNYPYLPRDIDDPRIADWSDELDFKLHDRFYSGAIRGDWDRNETQRVTLLSTWQRFQSEGSTIPQSGLGETSGERSVDANTHAYNVELRVAGTQGDDLDYVAGLFHSYDHVSEMQDLYAGSISTAFPYPGSGIRDLLEGLFPTLNIPLVGNLLIDRAIFEGDQTARSYAAFGQLGWRFADDLKLNTGLRYTYESRDYTGCTRDSPDSQEGVGIAPLLSVVGLTKGGTRIAAKGECASLGADGNPGEYQGSLSEDNISGRIGLDWTPTPDLLVYAAFSRGFKSGSFPVLSASDQSQYIPVKQEQLNAFEIGSKITLMDGKAQLNNAVFYYDYKDKQLLGNQNDILFGPLPVLVNAPKSRVIGAELEGRISPLPGLFFAGSVAYLDTEVLDFVGTNENAEPLDFAGNRFNFAPEWSYTLLSNYVYTLADRYDLSIGADYSYKGSTNSSLGEEAEYHHNPYGLINARLGFADVGGRWQLGLWGRNLTNEVTTISIQKASDPFSRYVGMPRTYGLSAGYRF